MSKVLQFKPLTQKPSVQYGPPEAYLYWIVLELDSRFADAGQKLAFIKEHIDRYCPNFPAAHLSQLYRAMRFSRDERELYEEFIRKACRPLAALYHDDWFSLQTGIALASFFSHEHQENIVDAVAAGAIKPNVLNKIAAVIWAVHRDEALESGQYLEFSRYHAFIGYYHINSYFSAAPR